jgi:Bifunctional DNA primase/polymerase, N-terminal
MTLLPVSHSSVSVYQTALAALHAGISCIPILADGTKRPAVKWKEYQRKKPTFREITHWFSGAQYGIAFITGEVSGGLEMLDFDTHTIYAHFAEHMQQEGLAWLLECIEHGYTERSPKGVHLYYRCPSCVTRNKKLAQRPLNEPPSVMSLIETRGEGGYSIGAPSSGGVHPSGLPYHVQCGKLATIQTIQPEERALLLSVARTLDEMPPTEKASATARRSPIRSPQSKEGRRPGTIFNERATWAAILDAYGWAWVKRIGVEDFWRRPGKDVGISATTNYEGSDLLYVFSTSTPFEPNVSISKFAAYTFLAHQGNFSEATKALVAQGYVAEEKHPFVRSSISYPFQ